MIMQAVVGWYVLGGVLLLWLSKRFHERRKLSKAQSSSLLSQPWISKRLARWIPFYEYTEAQFFAGDGAPESVAQRRRAGFSRLAEELARGARKSVEFTAALEGGVSEIQFSNTYRVPFPYRSLVMKQLKVPAVVTESTGVRVKDLDDNWLYDLSGSNGVNLFGYDFYKQCMSRGAARVDGTGLVLGPYHPVVADNVSRLRAISGLDEVSFHMSGTEAVMQAVRLARFHTGRSRLVRFNGAYHGWWDGVQSGAVSHREADDVYVLKEMSQQTLAVLRSRKDIACVLVNPMQALHPNQTAPNDSMLLSSSRRVHFDRSMYTTWLKELRQVCTERGIVLILDEVFVGFRIARGGAQEYFEVAADLVTYGKSLGGGFPIGVVCGKAHLMRRFREDRPNLTCFARGTFSAHPHVMGAMNEFLRSLEGPEQAERYAALDRLWNDRAHAVNQRLEQQGLPVSVANFSSIWAILYKVPSRYNWMLQFYLRAAGLVLGSAGSGRLVMPHTLSDEEWQPIVDRLLQAVASMHEDGFWYEDARLTNRAIGKQIFWEVLRNSARWGANAGTPERAVAAIGGHVAREGRPS
jgi:glutamate-1-semialdehyde 2,1-aminomutase